eukprot:COSAG06_NODE_4776_length_3961_cov_55.473071_5_plen_194_part_00
MASEPHSEGQLCDQLGKDLEEAMALLKIQAEQMKADGEQLSRQARRATAQSNRDPTRTGANYISAGALECGTPTVATKAVIDGGKLHIVSAGAPLHRGARPRHAITALRGTRSWFFWTEKYLPMARPHQLLLLLLAAGVSSVAAGDVTVSVRYVNFSVYYAFPINRSKSIRFHREFRPIWDPFLRINGKRIVD